MNYSQNFNPLASEPIDDPIGLMQEFADIGVLSFRDQSPHLGESWQDLHGHDDLFDEVGSVNSESRAI